MKICVLEPLGVSSQKMKSFLNRLEEAGHEVVSYQERSIDEDTLKERLMDAEIAVLTNIPIGKDVIMNAKQLKMLDVAFTGYDHIDLDSCNQKGITVSNAAGFSTTAVAELCISMALDLLRKTTELEGITRLSGTREGFLGGHLKGKTFGIIGTGMIGLETARIARAFGCEILAYSRSEKKEAQEAGIDYCSLQELCRRSDIISLHVPLNSATKKMITAEELTMMKDTALLINTARGGVVDYEALATFLKEGRIGGAAIDVYEYEPPLKADHPLLSAPNALLLPHIGYATAEAMEIRLDIVLENIIAFTAGKPRRVVNNPV